MPDTAIIDAARRVKAKTAPRTYRFPLPTANRIAELADARDVKGGEILRDALAIYGYIYAAQLEAKKNGRRFAVLLDRGDGQKPAEIIVPDLGEIRV
jgi:hypothetical protein